MDKLIKWAMSCGFNAEEARKEVETLIWHNTHGLDAVSREYAIQMMLEDIGEMYEE